MGEDVSASPHQVRTHQVRSLGTAFKTIKGGFQMPIRKIPLVKDEMYHIYTRSISGIKIFASPDDYERLINAMVYYSIANPPCKLSIFNDLARSNKAPEIDNSKLLINMIAYCIMPTHIHMVIKEIADNGISNFVNLILKSYGRYFNLKYERNGPLWQGPFKNVAVKTPEQLLHLTRYVHLNPVTAFIVNKPEDWPYSSYREYINTCGGRKICDFESFIENLEVSSYKEFVNSQIDHQRELSILKRLTLE